MRTQLGNFGCDQRAAGIENMRLVCGGTDVAGARAELVLGPRRIIQPIRLGDGAVPVGC